MNSTKIDLMRLKLLIKNKRLLVFGVAKNI